MDEKNKLPQAQIPIEDIPDRPTKPALEVVKKAPINPSNQVTDMAMKAEIEKQQQSLHPGQTPKPMPTPTNPAVIKHVWTKEDTYADLAFRYYGSIKEPYWRLIYNHNKQIIGNHPNIRVGLEIEIPPLPEDLKKK
jgi:nucleoid-associated protein YgaU